MPCTDCKGGIFRATGKVAFGFADAGAGGGNRAWTNAAEWVGSV
jgi:hypothetical protein